MTKQTYIEAIERTLRVYRKTTKICGQNDVSKYMGLGELCMLTNLAIDDSEISLADYLEISDLCTEAERTIKGN